MRSHTNLAPDEIEIEVKSVDINFRDLVVLLAPSTYIPCYLQTFLSFFITLPSVAGIVGSPNQANYAAGNTYRDALAQYRLSLGLKATSIDLGWMTKVGIVAENIKYTLGKEVVIDLVSISEDEFYALLECYCDPNLNYGVAALTQMGGQDERQVSSVEALVADEKAYANEFLQASTATKAAVTLVRGLLQKMARALSVAEEEIDVDRPLYLHGGRKNPCWRLS